MSAIVLGPGQRYTVHRGDECDAHAPVVIITRPLSISSSGVDGSIYTARLEVRIQDLRVDGATYPLLARSSNPADSCGSRRFLLDFCQYSPIVIAAPSVVEAYLEGLDDGVSPTAASLEAVVLPGDAARGVLAHASRRYSYTQLLRAAAGARTLAVPTGARSASWVGPASAPSLPTRLRWSSQWGPRIDLDRDALPGVCAAEALQVTPAADGYLRWEIELP